MPATRLHSRSSTDPALTTLAPLHAPTLLIDPPLPGRPVFPFFSRHRRQNRHRLTYPGEHIPLLLRLKPSARGHTVAVLGELVGTFLFIFFAFSGAHVAAVAATGSVPRVDGNGLTYHPESAEEDGVAKLLYVALAFGMGLAVTASLFFRISGGLFNPAVTLALCLVGSLAYVRGLLVILAQLLGAIIAAAVVKAVFPAGFHVQTRLHEGTSIARGLFIEMFLTTLLVLAVFMLAVERSAVTYLAPVGIGLALFVAELAGVYFTGGSLNPARSFAPCVVDGHFDGYHWIYWLGPLLGALLASAFYKLIKALEYETANPSPDEDDKGKKMRKGVDAVEGV